ncbi:hypothetical protein [Flagellimonas beolgyonensis]|uniref:hypothetical protein n=1 Tax=Flagellimonas beolgyonensis TaxID=864064 RepID=UPI003D65F996
MAVLLFLWAVSQFSGCSITETPPAVLNRFETQFPEARNEAWSQVDGQWQVWYKILGRSYTTFFDTRGHAYRTQEETTYVDLPDSIMEKFDEQYDDGDIKTVYKVQLGDTTVFEVLLKEAAGNMVLRYGLDGRLLEKRRVLDKGK